MIEYTKLLLLNMPGCQFSISNDGSDEEKYNSIIFHDDSIKPSSQQFVEWQKQYDEIQNKSEYSRKRSEEYPSYHELIVALWERVVENRIEASSIIEKNRQIIKQKYMKSE